MTKYQEQLVRQREQQQWQDFLRTVPISVWHQMTDAEQVQCWTAWQGQQSVVRSIGQSRHAVTSTLLWIFIGVPAILILLFVLL